MCPSSQEPSVKMLGDAMKGISAEAPSICGTTSASAGIGDTELPNPALESAWSAGSLAPPGSVRFQGDSTPAAKGEVVVVLQSVDDGQVVKIVQVGETAHIFDVCVVCTHNYVRQVRCDSRPGCA